MVCVERLQGIPICGANFARWDTFCPRPLMPQKQTLVCFDIPPRGILKFSKAKLYF